MQSASSPPEEPVRKGLNLKIVCAWCGYPLVVVKQTTPGEVRVCPCRECQAKEDERRAQEEKLTW